LSSETANKTSATAECVVLVGKRQSLSARLPRSIS